MKNIPGLILFGALVLIFLNSACSSLTGASTPIGTILPEGQTQVAPPSTSTSSVTATGISTTPLIPITGENVVTMQCQFCVQGETHAVLVFPDFAYFDVVSTSPMSCLTADVVNGRRILICRGTQQTSFNLTICSDSTNCLQFPVALQACPLLQDGTPQATFTPFAPFFLTPINTLNAPDSDSGKDPTQPASTAAPSLTPTAGSIPATPTSPPPTSTTDPSRPTATSVPPTNVPPPTSTEEPPTEEPEPPVEPTDSNENQGRPTRKPTKTSKPTNDGN